MQPLFNLNGGLGGAQMSQQWGRGGDPLYTARDTMSGALAGRMDPLSAVAAYLGIKRALGASHGPGAGAEFKNAQAAAADPLERLLGGRTAGAGRTNAPGAGRSNAGSQSRGGFGMGPDIAAEVQAKEYQERERELMIQKLALENAGARGLIETRNQINSDNAIGRIINQLLSRRG